MLVNKLIKFFYHTDQNEQKYKSQACKKKCLGKLPEYVSVENLHEILQVISPYLLNSGKSVLCILIAENILKSQFFNSSVFP